MRKLLGLLCLLSLTCSAQFVSLRNFDTNYFNTNTIPVPANQWLVSLNTNNSIFSGGSDVWTNQNGQYIYPSGTGPVVDDQTGPYFVLRTDGSTFVGTNVFRDINPTAAGIWHPYVVSMTDSNEANTLHADWWAIDNTNYGVYGGANIVVQQSGSSVLRLSSDDGPSSTLLRLNSTPGASDILLNENTDRFLASSFATNVVMANAVGQNWLFVGKTNGESTINVRADGSIFSGQYVELNGDTGVFSRLYFPQAFNFGDSNGVTQIRAEWFAVKNENYNEYGQFRFDAQSSGAATLLMDADTGPERRVISINAASGNTPFDYSSNNVTRFRVAESGDLAFIKGIDYSWPTARGPANAVLFDAAADGTLAWSNITALVTNNQARIGPGTNNVLAKFSVGGTNVENSPLISAWSNSVHLMSRHDGGSFTNSATNRMYGEWTNEGTNQWLELVVPKGHNNEVAHIRHMAIGELLGRAPLYLNDAWVVEPATNQLSGHPQGAFYPVGSPSGIGWSIGSSSSPVFGMNIGTGNLDFGVAAAKPHIRFGVGAAGISGDANSLSFWRPTTGITAAFGRQYNLFLFDLTANTIAFGSAISNAVSFIGGANQVSAQLAAHGWIQVGTNGGSATANKVGLVGGDGSDGSNAAGSDLRFWGGPSTGTGLSGAISMHTSPSGASGSSLNPSVTRFYLGPRPVTLTDNTITTLCSVSLASGRYASCKVRCTTYAMDGSVRQVVVDNVEFAIENTSGTVTAGNSTSFSASRIPSGTLTTALTAPASGNNFLIRMTADTSLTTTTFHANYRLEIDTDDTALTVTPQ